VKNLDASRIRFAGLAPALDAAISAPCYNDATNVCADFDRPTALRICQDSRSHSTSLGLEEIMNTVTRIGVDLAKNVM
jgi:hypothetical protein